MTVQGRDSSYDLSSFRKSLVKSTTGLCCRMLLKYLARWCVNWISLALVHEIGLVYLLMCTIVRKDKIKVIFESFS